MTNRVRDDVWMARILVLFLSAVLMIWFVCKVVHTADRAADVFVQANSTQYDTWALTTSFARRYTVFAVLTSSPCSVLSGHVVEASAKVSDVYGTTAVVYACFSGWWWEKTIPPVYVVDVGSRFQHLPQKGFP